MLPLVIFSFFPVLQQLNDRRCHEAPGHVETNGHQFGADGAIAGRTIKSDRLRKYYGANSSREPKEGSSQPGVFFFPYTGSDLLVVNTNDIAFVDRDADLQELLRRLEEPIKGTQYYLPLGGNEAASA